jgi:hypothetical protein
MSWHAARARVAREVLMTVVLALASLALIVLVQIDAFEAMVLPCRVTRLYRPTRMFYRLTWTLGRWQQNFLSLFGPL